MLMILLVLAPACIAVPPPGLDSWQQATANWRVTLKDGRIISSADLPIKTKVDGKSWSQTWTGDVRVTVTGKMDGQLVRSRIKVDTVKPGIGLKIVTYPNITGIKPLSDDDKILSAFRTGFTQPSPLTTGKPIQNRYSISYYMQFTALLGDGQGLYIGDHDPTAAWKDMQWSPDSEKQTLSYEVSHPVLDWNGAKPVTHYQSPGDSVFGLFQGDWFDAAQIYRKWAVTAPWCAKGPMHSRDDYPKWFLNLDYWALGHMGDYPGQRREFIKRDLFEFTNTITHDYGYYGQPYQHDVNVDYFPPRCGSINYQNVIKELRGRGGRVIPYVLGWMWNAAMEDYQLSGAKEKGAMRGADGESVLWAELSPSEECIAMCPASKIWRDKLTSVTMEHLKVYRTGGVYFDYFSNHMNDCHNPSHGHALGGGDYWSRSIHDLYKQVRDTAHKFDPEATFSGEDPAEFCIDVLDAHYTGSWSHNAPLWQAVYHDYTQLVGGMHWMEERPLLLGRQWLLGHIFMLSGTWGHHEGDKLPQNAQWQLDMLRCLRDFGKPYLGYGQMLRPPVVTGDLPTMKAKGGDGPFTAPAVEGTAWRAHDGSVGIFFFNYDDKAHPFNWTQDVAEIAELDASKKLQVTQWTAEHGSAKLKQISGGKIGDKMEIAPRGLIALKLEVIQ